MSIKYKGKKNKSWFEIGIALPKYNAKWAKNEAGIGFDGERCGWTGKKIGRLEGIKGKN